jgi:invasion protein IalB
MRWSAMTAVLLLVAMMARQEARAERIDGAGAWVLECQERARKECLIIAESPGAASIFLLVPGGDFRVSIEPPPKGMRLRVDGTPAAPVSCVDRRCSVSGAAGQALFRQARSGRAIFLEVQRAPDFPSKAYRTSLDGFDALFKRLLSELELLDVAGPWTLGCATEAGKKVCTVGRPGHAVSGRAWFTATSDGRITFGWLEFPVRARLRIGDGASISLDCTRGNGTCTISGAPAARFLADMGKGLRLRIELTSNARRNATEDWELAGFGALYRRAVSEAAGQ